MDRSRGSNVLYYPPLSYSVPGLGCATTSPYLINGALRNTALTTGLTSPTPTLPLTAGSNGLLGTGGNGLLTPTQTPTGPKWVIPHLTPSQINFLFKNRLDKKRAQTPVKCDSCNITLNSDQQAKQHFNGKAHIKRLRKLGLPIPEEHLGKVHAKTGKRRYPCICKDLNNAAPQLDAPNVTPGDEVSDSDRPSADKIIKPDSSTTTPDDVDTPPDPDQVDSDAPSPPKKRRYFHRRRWKPYKCEVCNCGNDLPDSNTGGNTNPEKVDNGEKSDKDEKNKNEKEDDNFIGCLLSNNNNTDNNCCGGNNNDSSDNSFSIKDSNDSNNCDRNTSENESTDNAKLSQSVNDGVNVKLSQNVNSGVNANLSQNVNSGNNTKLSQHVYGGDNASNNDNSLNNSQEISEFTLSVITPPNHTQVTSKSHSFESNPMKRNYTALTTQSKVSPGVADSVTDIKKEETRSDLSGTRIQISENKQTRIQIWNQNKYSSTFRSDYQKEEVLSNSHTLSLPTNHGRSLSTNLAAPVSSIPACSGAVIGTVNSVSSFGARTPATVFTSHHHGNSSTTPQQPGHMSYVSSIYRGPQISTGSVYGKQTNGKYGAVQPSNGSYRAMQQSNGSYGAGQPSNGSCRSMQPASGSYGGMQPSGACSIYGAVQPSNGRNIYGAAHPSQTLYAGALSPADGATALLSPQSLYFASYPASGATTNALTTLYSPYLTATDQTSPTPTDGTTSALTSLYSPYLTTPGIHQGTPLVLSDQSYATTTMMPSIDINANQAYSF